MVKIIINREYYINSIRSDSKPRVELFIKHPLTFFGNMRPHIHIGIIGYCNSFARPLISELIHKEIAEKFPGQDVQLTWAEPDKEELLSKLFPEETEKIKSRIDKNPYGIANDLPVLMVTLKNQPRRFSFDFQKRQKNQRFTKDLKSVRIEAKHRRA